jgi:XisI protein
VATLKDTLQHVLMGYAGEALNGCSYLTSSADQEVFTIVSIGQVRGQHIVDTGLVVRLVNDKIVVERDVNDKPLVDALVQAGVPRGQIVLAYAGESVEEAA